MSKIINLDDSNFEVEVLNKQGVVLVDFWASWCGPCRKIAPILDEISELLSATIAKVNVDEADELSRKYNIRSIPTIIIFKNGKIVETLVGLNTKEVLMEKLEKYSN